jgi:Na+/H+-dicarboxylate symporter
MTATLTPPEPRTNPGAGLRGLARLTWRQHRWFLVGTLIATLVVLGVAIWFTTGLRDIVSVMAPTDCDAGSAPRCPHDLVLKRDFYNRFILVPLWYAPVVLTLVVGVFVGAPMVAREYEQETHLLTWSQDVNPSRWFLSKTGLLAAAAAVLALVLGTAASSLASAYRSIPQAVQANIHWE